MLIRQTFFFLFLFPLILFSTEEPLPLEIEGDAESVAMDYVDATIYGIIEGVTEFLPISSTGHLIIASEVLDKKSSSELKKEAINAYLIVIQGRSYSGSSINIQVASLVYVLGDLRNESFRKETLD